MAKNEKTQATVAADAAWLLKHADEIARRIKSVAGSALTQAPDNPAKRKARAKVGR